MGRKTPPFEPYPTWTTARFWSFIRSALRQASSRWPPKYETAQKARRAFEGPGRQRWEYQCAKCKEWFPQKQISVDHIKPVGTLKDFDDLPAFVSNLFCSVDNLQILCDQCHGIKSNEEKKASG